MIKWILGFVLVVAVICMAIDAFACVTQTVIIDGKIINCTTCGTVTNCF